MPTDPSRSSAAADGPSAATGTDGPPAAPAPTPSSSARYQLQGEIARGGMGVVFAARDAVLNRDVAVKVLHERYPAGSAVVRRFVEEAKIAGQLQHPGVPPVHDLGALPDGRPFLAMKLIKGRTLDDLLKDRPDPAHDRGRFVAAFEQVCQAVAFAHDRGVIHRDLKPSNVMVGAFGEVQVMDWGLAKLLADGAGRSAAPTAVGETTPAVTEVQSDRDDGSATRAGSVLGTPGYMPPEQAIGAVEQIDRRSDVFGLGAILCQVLTGQPPYVGPDGEATRQLAARARLADALARLDGCGADPGLVDLCRRCLAPEPADRPADASQVAKAVAGLRAAADERARQAELDRVRAEAEAREQRRRRRTQAALGLTFTALVVLGGAFAWWQDRQAARRRAEERARAARNADALAALLTACEEALRAGDADRAAALLAEAERRLEDGGELRARADACRADLALLRDLNEADQFRWTWRGGKFPDGQEVAAHLRAAFVRFGLVPGEASTEEEARRVAASAVRGRLVAALDRWLWAGRSAGARALLQAADPDGFRDAVRDAVLTGDGAKVAALAGRAEALAQPAEFTAALGEDGRLPVERRQALLASALRRRPGDLGLLMALSNTYPINRREGAEERVRWLQAAVAAHPGNTSAHTNLSLALRDKGDTRGALAEALEAIRLDPKLANAHTNRGVALSDKGDPVGAVTAFREAIRLDPKSALLHYNLGLALKEREDLDGAVAALKQATRLDPRFTHAFYCLGIALNDKGDLGGAIAAYKEAIRLDPAFAWPHTNLGVALSDKGDLDGAVAAYKEGIRLDPKDAMPHYNLGIVLADKGDLDGAVAAYKEAIRLNYKTPAWPHNNLGNALRARGDLDGAVAEYKEAIRLDPRLALARNNLRQTERWRELLPRLPDVAAGRAEPTSPAEACEFAGLCALPFQKRYVLAVRLHRWAFAADPRLAADYRNNAARSAALAAAGKDAEQSPFGADEWWSLTDQARGWLRADLALWGAQAKDPKNAAAVRQKLSYLKRNPDLICVRDPAWLAAMPSADRPAWQAFWADVDGALASVSPPPRPAGP
jgi:tetratricopeptide (TPR) repeat protein